MQENKISLFSAILMNINVMIGGGIFIMVPIMAKQAANISFLGWVITALIFLPVVLSVAKITNYFPGQSSFYSYNSTGINKTAGFVSGWLYFLGYASNGALLIAGIREFLRLQLGIEFFNSHQILFNLIMVILFCLLNFLSISVVSKIQNAATIIKLLPIFFVIFLLFFYWNPRLRLDFSNISNLKYVVPLTLFGFWGFETTCNISHLIAGHKNNASRAIIISFLIVVAAYTIFTISLLHIMGAQNLITYEAPAFVKFLGIKSDIFLNALNVFVLSTILTSYAGSLFGLFIASSFNLQSLANNNLLPLSKILQILNKQNRPIYCVLLSGLTIFIFLLFLSNAQVLSAMGNFGILSCIIITFISLLLIQLKRKEYLKTLMPCLALLSCCIILIYTWLIIGINNAERFLCIIPMLALVALGMVMFKIKEKYS
ncbi:MAG: APC family permease [Candidatus Babeliales bacterium]